MNLIRTPDRLTLPKREPAPQGFYPHESGLLAPMSIRPVISGGAQSVYTCRTEGAIALSAATARTVCGVKAHANSGIDLKKIQVSFDGVSATAVGVLVEVCYCTLATKSPGTNSTSTTPN